MLTWHFVTRAAYDAADVASKTSEKLFFLSDTKEIYKGTDPFTESVIMYTTEPTVKAVGKLYVNANTLEGRIWNGSSWTTVIQPVQATIVSGDTTKPVSSKAVEDYVADAIADVTGSGDLISAVEYEEATNSLKVSKADGTSDTIPMTNVAADLVYDKTTGLLQVKNASGTTIGTGINLDLERFVSEAAYDHETGVITLKFNDNSDPLEIEIGDLVDTYTAKSTSTVALTVTGNEFAAEVIVAGTAGNQLTKTDSGLYVAATDLSNYYNKTETENYVTTQVNNLTNGAVADIAGDVDALEENKISKVESATVGAIATLAADGSLTDSGVKAGGATLEGTSVSVLATEAAVAAIRDTLTASINTKMAKVGTGHKDEIITADENGDAQASGVKVGGATLSASPNASTVATEAAVKTYVEGYAVAQADIVTAGNVSTTVAAASDEKVVSEKGVVDALTWKTTV